MAVRDNNDNLQPDDYKFYYSTGYYGNMDLKQYGMQFHSGNFGDYRMNGDQYTDYIINPKALLFPALFCKETFVPVRRALL